MCGIAGKVYRDPARPVEVGVLRAMCGAMAHRGPDDEQLFLDAGVGLGMRRLAVIDLAGGRQPMASEDKRVRAICNGEIYNFRALREELLAGGHRLETRSDVEVLPHLYEREGAGCVARLRGMFAFALWDAGARRLVLARDRLGKKPLVYAPLPDGLVFASELSALLLDPAVDRTLDLEALDAYLRCQAVPAPRTIYRGVRKLPPGHLLVWEDGRLRSEPYWRLDFTRKAAARPEERRARLRELLTESLRLRLVSDVPLGVLLSGGVDSTTLAALAARELAQPVETFSVGFAEAGYSELPAARRVAEHLGARHHEATVTLDVPSLLPTLARHYGEPFADKSAVPTYAVTRMARGSLTVALAGDGGDEAFAGYPRYLTSGFTRRLPFGPGKRRRLGRGLLRRALALDASRSEARLARHALEPLAPPARSVLFPEFFPGHALAKLYRPEVRAAVAGRWEAEVLGRWDAVPEELDDLDAALCLDYGLYLPETLLVKMDVASMANSLEVRAPFLDHQLVEFAASLPAEAKIAGGVGKAILRDLARDLVPPEILAAPKRGFSAPVAAWLRGPLRSFAEATLLREAKGLPAYFQPQAVRALWEAHQSGRENHAMRLWALLVFEVWYRTCVGGAGAPSPNRPGSQ